MSRIQSAAAVLLSLFAVAQFATQPAHAVSSSIVISQVYGGGGNSGATLKNDFIELFNRGGAPVSLNGWSVQYASTAGTTWQKTNLTNVTLAPGQYYLVQEAAGTGGTTSLPTPDATGSIAMAAGAGKVALVNTQTTIASGTVCPVDASIVDTVGYGTGTNCFEGAGPTATLTNTTAALRGGGGCTDTDQNGADFATGGPNARNTATPASPCSSGTNPTGVGRASPSNVLTGYASLLTVAVTPGASPTSTGLAVTVNLSTVGGSTTTSFFDDGTHGDAVPNDHTFSLNYTVPEATAGGARSLPVTIADAQSRTGTTSIPLTLTTSLPSAATAALPLIVAATLPS